MRRLSCALLVAATLAVSLGATSCGGGGNSGEPDLVLIGFNKPNVAGIALNEVLIFTFSSEIDLGSITPDTLRVTGAVGPFFEATVVDGNLVALLPRSPNFEDYSDAGYAPGTTYSVDFAVFPAPSTITTPRGNPLLDADGYQFTTVPFPLFVEPRRPINHGLAPSQGGRSDDEGCLQNPDNQLYDGTVQFGSGPGARLLCLKNQGSPRVILNQCSPGYNDQSVGTPSAVTPGAINLPAIRVRLNEPLDPITVVPYVPTTKLGINVQLWRVGDTEKIPIPPEPIRTNKPLIVQSLEETEIILVASNEDEFGNPIGGVLQGTYLVNVTTSVTDLPGNPLVIADRPNPAIGGFDAIDATVSASGSVAPGYRIYFVSLRVPGTSLSFNDGYNTSLNEWGDAQSGTKEPGVFEQSDTGAESLRAPIPGTNVANPAYTLDGTIAGAGQSTTANWNGGFRFLGRSSLPVNANVDDGVGRLKAVFRPWAGSGADGDFDSGGGGTSVSLGTEAVAGNSVNGDGIYEFESFTLQSGDTLGVAGTRPLLILCRGDVTIDGLIDLSGSDGGPGLDTDGTSIYTAAGAIDASGVGGGPGAGGGTGGRGADPFTSFNTNGVGSVGGVRVLVFGAGSEAGGGGGLADPQGGGGAGHGSGGGGGTDTAGVDAGNGGAAIGDSVFGRALALFAPDRTYSPNTDVSGGPGGGGGGLDDTNGNTTVENGDAGGGGGGGGGGGIWILAAGAVTVNGTIACQGSAGGNTYARADQSINLGADNAVGGTGADQDFVQGIQPGATPSGLGGPGGGGAGGGIYLMGAQGVLIASTAVLDAQGGGGGACGDSDMRGGDGANGKIVLAYLGANSVSVDGSASVAPTQVVSAYLPTVDTWSSGVSEWYDMFTGTAVFEEPYFQTNIQELTTAGLVQGVDFTVIVEYQGAANLDPLPGGSTPPSSATGLTQWDPDITTVNTQRYVRYRWRFFVKTDFPSTTQPMPSVSDFTIPFTR